METNIGKIVPLSTLKEWDKNPRNINTVDFARLKLQIEHLGQYKPLLAMVDGDSYIVLGGNMRLKALRDLGTQTAWISEVRFEHGDDNIWYVYINGQLSAKRFQEKEDGMMEYALSDNDRAGYYDDELLANLLPNLNVDWNQYAVDLTPPTNIQELLNKMTPTEEDDPPAVDETQEPVSKVGEVYQLGRHRLMCGDSTVLENVKTLMNGQTADMVFTDPPYNVDYEGKTKDALTIQNDKFSDSATFYQFLLDAFTAMNAYSKSGASIYVCHADSEGLNFRKAFVDAGYLLKQCIVWNKNMFVMGRQDYQWKHEPILYGWKEGASHTFYGDRTQTTVWDIERPSRSEEHPTMKPLELIKRALQNSTKSDDIVLDLFGGSGSTLMACEQNQRICYMMELDPKYCDVIRKRYAKYLNQEENWQQLTTKEYDQTLNQTNNTVDTAPTVSAEV